MSDVTHLQQLALLEICGVGCRFTLDLFKTVQAEYEAEGIAWDRIDFVDNAPVRASCRLRVRDFSKACK